MKAFQERRLHPMRCAIVFGIIAGLVGACAVWALRPEHSVSAIINEWSPRVAMVTCEFLDADGSNSAIAASGLLIRGPHGEPRVLTIRDALGQGGNTPLLCHVDIAGQPTIDVLPAGFITSTTDEITGALQMPLGTTGLPPAGSFRRCAASEPVVGDRVVVLGYPYSATTPIVATEGIISGASSAGDRYLTSAYLTSASFGGAAIDVEHDCYLGMPELLTASDNAPGPGEILKWQQYVGEFGEK